MRAAKFLVIFALLISSCQKIDLDSEIARLDTIDFSLLKGSSIYYRSNGSTLGSNIYFLFEGDCLPIAIELKNRDLSTAVLNDELVTKSCPDFALNEQEAIDKLRFFFELNVGLIAVDSLGNVMVNPYQVDRPILLKLSPNGKPEQFEQFEPYAGDWFIRRGVALK